MFAQHHYRDRGVAYPVAVTAKIRRSMSERLDTMAKAEHKHKGELVRELLEWAISNRPPV